MISIDVAIAKTHKYASRDSGDTVEMGERPTGGFTVVMVDGQGSGKAAKTLSMLVSSRALSLTKEGVRDGAVARGTHDFLHAFRGGRVSATLDLISVDLATSEVVVARNSHVPYIIGRNGEYCCCNRVTGPIGLERHVRPIVDRYPIEAGLSVIAYSDGVMTAGKRAGAPFDTSAYLADHARDWTSASDLADGILMAAIDADGSRPRDDMSVVVLSLVDDEVAVDPIRRMRLTVPLKSL